VAPNEAGKLYADRQIRAFKAIAAVLTAVPLIGGLAGAMGGPTAVTGYRGATDASLDSEFRFLSAAWLAVAPLVWSALPTAERRPWPLRIIGAGIIFGGAARLSSWRRHGRPRAMMVAAAALELLGVPALLAWHAKVVRQIKGDSVMTG